MSRRIVETELAGEREYNDGTVRAGVILLLSSIRQMLVVVRYNQRIHRLIVTHWL